MLKTQRSNKNRNIPDKMLNNVQEIFTKQMRILTDEVTTYKEPNDNFRSKKKLADINKPMGNFIIRLDLDNKEN